LLNATLPGNWNKLAIALSIVMVGEIMICMILAKTTPRRKAKHKHKHRTHKHEETSANGFRSRFVESAVFSRDEAVQMPVTVSQMRDSSWALPLNDPAMLPDYSVQPSSLRSQFRPGIRRHVLVQP